MGKMLTNSRGALTKGLGSNRATTYPWASFPFGGCSHEINGKSEAARETEWHSCDD